MEMSKKKKIIIKKTNKHQNYSWNMTDLVQSLLSNGELHTKEFGNNVSGQGSIKNIKLLFKIVYCEEIWR